jgi:Domain of unknown function (DU1801)
MVSSKAASVQEYLDELPEERRTVVSAVRKTIRKNLPAGYREGMLWGMITYTVPLERFPDTYNGQPLMYAALAAQKNNFAVYLTCHGPKSEERSRLEAGFRKAGKKLDMGGSCIRFRKLEEIPLGVIGDAVGSVPVEKLLARYREVKPAAKSRAKKKA